MRDKAKDLSVVAVVAIAVTFALITVVVAAVVIAVTVTWGCSRAGDGTPCGAGRQRCAGNPRHPAT